MPTDYVLIFDHIIGHFECIFSVYESAVESGKLRGVEEFTVEGPDGLSEHWVQDYGGEWGKEGNDAD